MTPDADDSSHADRWMTLLQREKRVSKRSHVADMMTSAG